jgi:hypothetical protein
MLRIFRSRFATLHEAEQEVEKVKLIGSYLGPDHLAHSEEFIVDYRARRHSRLLLCGLQEYVEGKILDPWKRLDLAYLASLWREMDWSTTGNAAPTTDEWTNNVRRTVLSFVTRVRKMIVEAGHIPDLAGVGNLLLTPGADIKLVDINNVSPVSFTRRIPLDDRGYPVCDKSVQALCCLEHKLLRRSARHNDPLNRTFLDPVRMQEVSAAVKAFEVSVNKAKPGDFGKGRAR